MKKGSRLLNIRAKVHSNIERTYLNSLIPDKEVTNSFYFEWRNWAILFHSLAPFMRRLNTYGQR